MRPALILALAAVIGVAACADDTNRYKRVTASLEIQGKLRTDYDPPDVPFSDADLERNFVEVALFSEFNREGEAERTARDLRKWEGPISYRIVGDGVTAKDRADIDDLMTRLTRLTGLPMQEVEEGGNFFIAILGDEERRVFNDAFEDRLGPERVAFQRMWETEFRFPCVGRIFYSAGGTAAQGLVLIKDEVQGVYRTSCIHEEIVQSLGLINDGDDVRPSLFNDTQEFALMTRHDEYLLRMLYDERLRIGMGEEEVRPLLAEIIADLRAEDAS